MVVIPMIGRKALWPCEYLRKAEEADFLLYPQHPSASAVIQMYVTWDMQYRTKIQATHDKPVKKRLHWGQPEDWEPRLLYNHPGWPAPFRPLGVSLTHHPAHLWGINLDYQILKGPRQLELMPSVSLGPQPQCTR